MPREKTRGRRHVEEFTEPLGVFEHKILASVSALGAGAYGASIGEFIRENDRKEYFLAQIYSALSRLESKGLVEPAGRPQGRRIAYKLTPQGRRALIESREAFRCLADFPANPAGASA